MLLARPALLETTRRRAHAIPRKVIQHHHVRARRNRLVRLCLALHFDLNLDREASGRARGHHRLRDAAARPHVVVLEHHHRAQVHAVPVRAARQHAVLFHQPEPGRRLARARQDALVPRGAHLAHQIAAARRDAGAARQRVERHALAEQDEADGPGHGGDFDLGLLGGDGEDVALGGVPLDGAAQLGKDFVEKGTAGNDAAGFTPERGGALTLADDEAAVVAGRRVFGEPGRDLRLPARRQQVAERALGEGGLLRRHGLLRLLFVLFVVRER